MLHRSPVVSPGAMAEGKRTYVKDVEFKMKTGRIPAKICRNEVMSFSEKCPGRGDGETSKLPDGTFHNFGNEVPVKS